MVNENIAQLDEYESNIQYNGVVNWDMRTDPPQPICFAGRSYTTDSDCQNINNAIKLEKCICTGTTTSSVLENCLEAGKNASGNTVCLLCEATRKQLQSGKCSSAKSCEPDCTHCKESDSNSDICMIKDSLTPDDYLNDTDIKAMNLNDTENQKTIVWKFDNPDEPLQIDYITNPSVKFKTSIINLHNKGKVVELNGTFTENIDTFIIKDTNYQIRLDNSVNLCTTFSEESVGVNFRYKGLVKRKTTSATSTNSESVDMIFSWTKKCPMSDSYCLDVNSTCTDLTKPVELGFQNLSYVPLQVNGRKMYYKQHQSIMVGIIYDPVPQSDVNLFIFCRVNKEMRQFSGIYYNSDPTNYKDIGNVKAVSQYYNAVRETEDIYGSPKNPDQQIFSQVEIKMFRKGVYSSSRNYTAELWGSSFDFGEISLNNNCFSKIFDQSTIDNMGNCYNCNNGFVFDEKSSLFKCPSQNPDYLKVDMNGDLSLAPNQKKCKTCYVYQHGQMNDCPEDQTAIANQPKLPYYCTKKYPTVESNSKKCGEKDGLLKDSYPSGISFTVRNILDSNGNTVDILTKCGTKDKPYCLSGICVSLTDYMSFKMTSDNTQNEIQQGHFDAIPMECKPGGGCLKTKQVLGVWYCVLCLKGWRLQIDSPNDEHGICMMDPCVSQNTSGYCKIYSSGEVNILQQNTAKNCELEFRSDGKCFQCHKDYVIHEATQLCVAKQTDNQNLTDCRVPEEAPQEVTADKVVNIAIPTSNGCKCTCPSGTVYEVANDSGDPDTCPESTCINSSQESVKLTTTGTTYVKKVICGKAKLPNVPQVCKECNQGYSQISTKNNKCVKSGECMNLKDKTIYPLMSYTVGMINCRISHPFDKYRCNQCKASYTHKHPLPSSLENYSECEQISKTNEITFESKDAEDNVQYQFYKPRICIDNFKDTDKSDTPQNFKYCFNGYDWNHATSQNGVVGETYNDNDTSTYFHNSQYFLNYDVVNGITGFAYNKSSDTKLKQDDPSDIGKGELSVLRGVNDGSIATFLEYGKDLADGYKLLRTYAANIWTHDLNLGYNYPLAMMKATRAEKIEVLEQISNHHLPIIQGEIKDNKTGAKSKFKFLGPDQRAIPAAVKGLPVMPPHYIRDFIWDMPEVQDMYPAFFIAQGKLRGNNALTSYKDRDTGKFCKVITHGYQDWDLDENQDAPYPIPNKYAPANQDEACYYTYMAKGKYSQTREKGADCTDHTKFGTGVMSTYGPNSRCFMFKPSNDLPYQPKCFQTQCHQDGYIQIKVGGSKPFNFNCKDDDGKPQKWGMYKPDKGIFAENSPNAVDFTDGQIECPDYDRFCGYLQVRCPMDCHGHGKCHEDRTCQCWEGFFGESCNYCKYMPGLGYFNSQCDPNVSGDTQTMNKLIVEKSFRDVEETFAMTRFSQRCREFEQKAPYTNCVSCLNPDLFEISETDVAEGKYLRQETPKIRKCITKNCNTFEDNTHTFAVINNFLLF